MSPQRPVMVIKLWEKSLGLALTGTHVVAGSRFEAGWRRRPVLRPFDLPLGRVVQRPDHQLGGFRPPGSRRRNSNCISRSQTLRKAGSLALVSASRFRA